ncbi:hypothetical protein [Cohnella nanjingensis]|uniref:Uncharacterized protein n=1 Tax=Cohnella nanjingensis TaxID=1387779 RepID=A0A7X0RS59_9BACL|nr:hypothetical protein [Cohnella nanjingensis]MBB6671269.1 hypothetical protein [Cohnella nanjingensis]
MKNGLVKLLLAALAITLLPMTGPGKKAAAAATITQDTTNKKVTMSGSRYSLVFDYNAQARVSSLVVDGKQTLDTSTGSGIFTGIYNGSWVTTQGGIATPSVNVNMTTKVVTASISTSAANETWTFTVTDANVSLKIDRTFKANMTVWEQGMPIINWEDHAFEQMRWPGDGGNFPIGGTLLNKQRKWLGTDAGFDSNIRVSKEQISYTMLNPSTSLALSVTGTSNRSGLDRGAATEVRRVVTQASPTVRALRMFTVVSATDLQYATGTPLGYSTDDCTGRMRCDGASIFSPIAVTNGQTDSVTLTFVPDTLSIYYDLGILYGVDQQALSYAINNYARWMMQDKKRGASAEASVMKSEVPPLEMQWIGQLIEIFGSPEAVTAYKYGLENIRDYLIESGTGQVLCCRPGSATSYNWGTGYRDQASGYALGVAKAYALDGQASWLQTMKASVESGLDYAIGYQIDPVTNLVTNMNNTSDTIYSNDYWESSTGTYNGYASALLYDALLQWANLERNVLGNTPKAATYESVAATLKTNFNKDFTAGGLWSPITQSFLYGSGNQDVRHLPTQAAVLKSDIVTNERKAQIVAGVESEVYANKANHHFMNYRDLYIAGTTAPSCGKGAENGGWYGVPEGDFFAGYPALNDRTKIPVYEGNFLNRYYGDGLYDSSAWHRDNPYQGCGFEYWFPTHVMPVWGLYAYGYGFQPQYDELILAPFISSEMSGSVVKYTWRSQPLTVTYNSQTSFTVNAPSLPTDIRIRFLNQTPGSSHTVLANDSPVTVTADANGNVDAIMSVSGTRTYECTTCTINNPGTGGTSFVTAVQPNEASLRTDVTEQVGFKFTIGSTPITVTQLGRMYHAGNNKVHTVKLVDPSGKVIATASVDMNQGAPDSLGFKYGGITPVTLNPNTSYYIYSLEIQYGDNWYNNTAFVSTTSAASVDNASYGDRIVNGSAGNTYGAVNFKYQ